MKRKIKTVPGANAVSQGFLASEGFCDHKGLGNGGDSNKGPELDPARIVSEVPAPVAGMFSTNQVWAALVKPAWGAQ